MKHYTSKLICQHLKGVGINDPHVPTTFIMKLVKHNGANFAADYLKQISYALKQSMISGKYILPENHRTRRILSYGKRRTISAFKWVHNLIELAMKVNVLDIPLSLPVVKKLHAVINLRYVLRSQSPTKADIEKFLSAVNKPPAELGPSHLRMAQVNKQAFNTGLLDKVKLKINDMSLTPTIYEANLNGKSSPNPKDLKMYHNTDIRSRTITPLLDLYERVLSNIPINSNQDKLYEDIKARIHRIIWYDDIFSLIRQRNEQNIKPRVGLVLHNMEAGCKDRVVTAPFMVFQLFFEPLKIVLRDLVIKHPSLSVMDHQDGRRFGVKSLAQGNKLYCFDATSFTDVFPLELQTQYLDSLGLFFWSDYLKALLEMPVYDTFLKKDIKYMSGQPMGLGPSFFLATLTHVALLDNISEKIYGRPQFDKYRIVGDDVIISDYKIARLYHKLMMELQVPINMSKSVISNRYGEFCGAFFDRRSMMPMFKPKDFRVNTSQIQVSTAYYGRRWAERLSLDTSVPISVRKVAGISKKVLNLFGGPERATSLDHLLKIMRSKIGSIYDTTRPQHGKFYEEFYSIIENVRKYNMLEARRHVDTLAGTHERTSIVSKRNNRLTHFSYLLGEEVVVHHKNHFVDQLNKLHDILIVKENKYLLDFIKNGILSGSWSLSKSQDCLTLAYYIHEYIRIVNESVDIVKDHSERETFISEVKEIDHGFLLSSGDRFYLSKTENPTATTYMDYDIIQIKDI